MFDGCRLFSDESPWLVTVWCRMPSCFLSWWRRHVDVGVAVHVDEVLNRGLRVSFPHFFVVAAGKWLHLVMKTSKEISPSWTQGMLVTVCRQRR